MILDMSIETSFTTIHMVLTLMGIVSGVIVLVGIAHTKKMEAWAVLFLIVTALTCLTGIFLPSFGFSPSSSFAFIALIIAPILSLALYLYRFKKSWLWMHMVSALVTLYINVCIGIVLISRNMPDFVQVIPIRLELGIVVVQSGLLACYIAFMVVSIKSFHARQGKISHNEFQDMYLDSNA